MQCSNMVYSVYDDPIEYPVEYIVYVYRAYCHVCIHIEREYIELIATC